MSVVADVRNLSVVYQRAANLWGGGASAVHAVTGVNLQIQPGEVLGLVGESGCGKSSLGRALLRLIEPTAGEIFLNGTDFRRLRGEQLRTARQQVQMVFQDPYGSLDPRMTVFETLAEPLRAHRRLAHAELAKKIYATLDLVGLPREAAQKYPHEFSGGQRQRVAIGRALILDPKLLIADEPVSSLDVSVQAQILNLLKEIQGRLGLAMLFISHNLAVVRYISDRVAVMYLGQIVEIADRDSLYRAPQHPYTRALLSAVPIPDPKAEKARNEILLQGEIPSRQSVPVGCCFRTRCPIAVEKCATLAPLLEPLPGQPSHRVACFEA